MFVLVRRVRSATALAVMVGLALLVSGCTIGRYYKDAPLRADPSALVEGRSTKSDVLHLCGPPTRIEHQTDGDAFIYTYQQQNLSSITLQEPITGQRLFTYRRQLDNRDTLVVLFDFAGVVRAVAIDHHVEDMPPI